MKRRWRSQPLFITTTITVGQETVIDGQRYVVTRIRRIGTFRLVNGGQRVHYMAYGKPVA